VIFTKSKAKLKRIRALETSIKRQHSSNARILYIFPGSYFGCNLNNLMLKTQSISFLKYFICLTSQYLSTALIRETDYHRLQSSPLFVCSAVI